MTYAAAPGPGLPRLPPSIFIFIFIRYILANIQKIAPAPAILSYNKKVIYFNKKGKYLCLNSKKENY